MDELQLAVEALRACEAEMDGLKADLSRTYESLQGEANARIEAETDAARYRWLRADRDIGFRQGVPWCVTLEHVMYQMPEMRRATDARLDAAIDAAIASYVTNVA